MKALYDSVSRKQRAAQLRRDGAECERRGYPGFAAVNYELAGWLDPRPVERRIAPVRSIREAREAKAAKEVKAPQARLSAPHTTHVAQRHLPPVRSTTRTRPMPTGTVPIRRAVSK